MFEQLLNVNKNSIEDGVLNAPPLCAIAYIRMMYTVVHIHRGTNLPIERRLYACNAWPWVGTVSFESRSI